MPVMDLAAVLITLAALFAYFNYRFVKLPTTIGIMLLAIVVSAVIVGLGHLGLPGVQRRAADIVTSVDFSDTLMNGMLSFLLFAGALHVNLGDLSERGWTIGLLATLSLLLTVTIVGAASFWIFGLFGFGIPLIYCLVFGALIAPTDPVAVLSILRKAGVSKQLETSIVGESLFNDGVAVVVFIILMDVASRGHGIDPGHVALLFAEEMVGGLVFGLVVGGLAYFLMRSVDNYQVEVLITLAVVTGGYALADSLHLSGPIAMVVAGLLIGNHGRVMAMSETTRARLDAFWELIDETLNAVLFLLIGLEVLAVSVVRAPVVAGLLMIPVVLASRLVSVSVPVTILGRFRDFTPGTVRILTWGGLHGGISVALALSIPHGEVRSVLVLVTYTVVVFSIGVQGMTVGRLARRIHAGTGDG